MLHLSFTAGDVARTRFAPSPAPMLELTAAVATLQRRDPLFVPWRHRTARVLPPAAAPLFELVPETLAGPLFLDPVTLNFEDGLDTVLSTPAEAARDELHAVFAGRPRVSTWVRALEERDPEAWRELRDALVSGYEILLATHWPQIRACYQAELELKGRQWASAGVGGVLTTIHPGTQWDGSALHIPVETRLRIDLRGLGVTLMPSVFWRGRPLFTRHPDGSLVIVYPAATPLPLAATSRNGNGNGNGRSSVVALLGSNRAGVLAAATSASTTTELARAAGISLASASEHATILRNAGLISSRREGRQVAHSVTWLGQQLLAGG